MRPYSACRFDDGLSIVERTPLPEDVKGRTVQTILGQHDVELLHGLRLGTAYPGTDIFANIKVEQLPAATFAQGKTDLIANFDYIIASGDDSVRNPKLAPYLNGFEAYGLDRIRLEGGVLGIYLLVDDRAHIVTTVYFLNQDSEHRKFANLDEYARLRDHFLNQLTACVHPSIAPKPDPRKQAPMSSRASALPPNSPTTLSTAQGLLPNAPLPAAMTREPGQPTATAETAQSLDAPSPTSPVAPASITPKATARNRPMAAARSTPKPAASKKSKGRKPTKPTKRSSAKSHRPGTKVPARTKPHLKKKTAP